MNIWFFVKLIALIAIQSLLAPKRDSPRAGDVELPTVSQSRKIPLVFGKFLVSGPNVEEATQAQKRKIKKGGGLFSKKQTVGFQFYQNIEFSVAYGPGELFKIFYADHAILDQNITTNSTVSVDKSEIFGPNDQAGGGGFSGSVQFIPGDGVGYINSDLQTATSRTQPGCPYLARVYMYDTGRGAYWGNFNTYRPISFEYGYYPNPGFQSPALHKINGDANPAYILYAINKDRIFGLGIKGDINTSDIAGMASTLYSEGLGFSRAFYQGDAAAIESEILEYIEGVRYRDPTNGQVRYKLIREGGDVSPLPTLGDSEIIEFKLGGNTISAVGTEIDLTYTDRDGGYKPVTITENNPAAFQNIGRTITVTREFLGCTDGTLARKLAQRESAKLTKPIRSGVVTCTRKAWDWSRGDAFLLSYSPVGLSSMVVRVTDIEKGDLLDGRIVISFVEDIFSFGTSVFDVQTITSNPVQSAPTDVTTDNLMELPAYLIEDNPDNRVVLFTEDPGAHSGFYLQLNLGSWADVDDGQFVDSYPINANASASATSIDITGTIFDASAASETDILQNRRNLAVIIKADGSQEIIGFEGTSVSAGVTTLTAVHRGLIDTFPQPLTTSDKLFIINEGQLVDYVFPDSQAFTYRYLPYSSQGVLSTGSATTHNHTIVNRYDAPLLPGNIKINGSAFPSAITGGITVTWNHRDRTAQTNATLDWDDTTDQGPESSVTYTVTTWDTSTSPWTQLDQQTGLSGKTYTYNPSPIPTTTIRIEVKAVRSGTNSFQTFYHDMNWSA